MSRLKLLGQNIKKYREVKGLTQNELAESVDLSREYIADIERGHKNLSFKRFYMIADALNVKCSDLINFD